MANVLIVDDSPFDKRLATTLLDEAGMVTAHAGHGKEALVAVAAAAPDLILTDLQMPEMDGLELVKEMRIRHPAVPVILMTAHGSEEIAVEALRSGAASYVPKKNLPTQLVQVVHDVLSITMAQNDKRRVIEWMHATRSTYVLGPEINGVQSLVAHFEDGLRQMDLCDDTDLVRVGTALHEALVNAIEHGNLELESDLKEQGGSHYRDLAIHRATTPPWSERKVRVTVEMNREHASFTISDDGPGFNPESLPDPTDPANLERASGRGLLLIRTFMDDVVFNPNGNEITLIKRKSEPSDEDEF